MAELISLVSSISSMITLTCIIGAGIMTVLLWRHKLDENLGITPKFGDEYWKRRDFGVKVAWLVCLMMFVFNSLFWMQMVLAKLG